MNGFISGIVSMLDLFSSQYYWLLIMFCNILSMLPELLHLHRDSRWWFYRRIYRYGILYLSFIIPLIIVIRHVGLSPTPEYMAFSTPVNLLCGVSILWGAVCLVAAVLWEHQISLRQKELQEIGSKLDDLIYRSVGRFRVRENDDDFKCFTTA